MAATLNSTTNLPSEHFASISEQEEKELRRVFETLTDYAQKAPLIREKDNLERWLSENKSRSHSTIDEVAIETNRRIEEIQRELKKFDTIPYSDKRRKMSVADVTEKIQELKQIRPRRRETEDSDSSGERRWTKISKREIEEMVWEVDENLDGFLDWQEFKLMFNRNITDRTGLEPSRMFNLTQFLIYDSKNQGYITVDETMHLLYARYGRVVMEQKLKELFGEDMQETGIGGGEITYDEYVASVDRVQLAKFLETNLGRKAKDIQKLFAATNNSSGSTSSVAKSR
jgi:Ca2+-binding EF-hand superfamily protein